MSPRKKRSLNYVWIFSIGNNIDIDCKKKYGSIIAGKVKLFYTKMPKNKIDLKIEFYNKMIAYDYSTVWYRILYIQI